MATATKSTKRRGLYVVACIVGEDTIYTEPLSRSLAREVRDELDRRGATHARLLGRDGRIRRLVESLLVESPAADVAQAWIGPVTVRLVRSPGGAKTIGRAWDKRGDRNQESGVREGGTEHFAAGEPAVRPGQGVPLTPDPYPLGPQPLASEPPPGLWVMVEWALEVCCRGVIALWESFIEWDYRTGMAKLSPEAACVARQDEQRCRRVR